jgi:hypothetical protein
MANDGELRLGLVAATTSGQAIRAAAWEGSTNHAPGADVAAVVGSWDERFGVRVVELGWDTLTISVAAPPATLTDALPIAAERFAICPDQIEQGFGTMTALAEATVDAGVWWFWWE